MAEDMAGSSLADSCCFHVPASGDWGAPGHLQQKHKCDRGRHEGCGAL